MQILLACCHPLLVCCLYHIIRYFFSRAWNRFRNVFAEEETIAAREVSIEQETVLDVSEGTCSSDAVSGGDFCDVVSRIRASINSLRRSITQRLDEDIEPRLRDSEEAVIDIREREIKKQVGEEVKRILGGCVNENQYGENRFTETNFVSRYGSCKNYCETKGKICLMGVGDERRYSRGGRAEESNSAFQPFGCNGDPEFILRNFHQVHCICC